VSWSHALSANNAGSGTAPTIAKPGGVAAGQLLYAWVGAAARVTAWPPGWQADGESLDDSGNGWSWGHRVASAAEPTTYTWKSGSGGWIVVLDAFTGVTLDAGNILLQSWPILVAATGTTLLLPRPWLPQANDLVVYSASSQGTPTMTMSAGPTLAQTISGVSTWWEIPAAAGNLAQRTVTYGTSTLHRIGNTVVYGGRTPETPAVHTLSGSGTVTIAAPVALAVSLSGIPSGLGTGRGNPTRYFELGNLAWGTASGYGRNYYLEHAAELVIAPFPGATALAYSFAPGITATVTELQSLP